MHRDPRLYLDDILEAVVQIRKYTASLDYGMFAQDRKTQDAVVRNLEIIGEAASRLQETVKAAAPDIKWRKIVGLRKKNPGKDQTLPVQSRLLLYRTEDGQTRIEVRLENETVWLSQLTMAALFQTSKQNISLHLKNIFNEGELEEDRVVKEYLTTAADRKSYRTKFYNLKAIIAVGYRVQSHRGTQFRRWATERLNEYLVKGFTMDDARLKEIRNIGSDYFDELLERIRDIRSSEKRFYQKIRDIYKLARAQLDAFCKRMEAEGILTLPEASRG